MGQSAVSNNGQRLLARAALRHSDNNLAIAGSPDPAEVQLALLRVFTCQTASHELTDFRGVDALSLIRLFGFRPVQKSFTILLRPGKCTWSERPCRSQSVTRLCRQTRFR